MYARFVALDHQLILMLMEFLTLKTTVATNPMAQPLAPATLHQAMPVLLAPVMHSVRLVAAQMRIAI